MGSEKKWRRRHENKLAVCSTIGIFKAKSIVESLIRRNLAVAGGRKIHYNADMTYISMGREQ